jgi:hypothetical protein
MEKTAPKPRETIQKNLAENWEMTEKMQKTGGLLGLTGKERAAHGRTVPLGQGAFLQPCWEIAP